MAEYANRQLRLQQKMKRNHIDAFIITQNVDLYYFTGSMQLGYLVLPAKGEAIFFVRRSLFRAQQEYEGRVEPLESLQTFKARLEICFPTIFQKKSPVFATEYDVLPLFHFQRLESSIIGVKWVDGSLLVRETRMIKSPYEIEKIKKSAAVIDIAFEKAIPQLEAGMSEIHFIGLMESYIRQMGHLGFMRMRGYNLELSAGIVVSGPSAAVPTFFDGPAGGEGLSSAYPIGSSWRKLERNVPILIDVGCCIEGYLIDQSRTVVIGDLPEDLKFAYDVSEKIAKKTEKNLKPHMICEQLYLDALDVASKAGLAENFMGYGLDRVKFLGHGIGLEVDEFPVLAQNFKYPLEPGMVIAVEPKFTFPDRGVVGVEDTYLITETGYDKLSLTRGGLIRI